MSSSAKNKNKNKSKRPSIGQRTGSFGWRSAGPAADDAKKLERLERFASAPDVARPPIGWRKTTPQVHQDAGARVDDFGFVSKGASRRARRPGS